MKLGFFSKIQILLNSRKIFKNWHIYPKVYWQRTNDEFAVFETKTDLKLKVRVKSTDLMALTNVWMINEYDVESFKINQGDNVIAVSYTHLTLPTILLV